ncbi:MAG TPA: hypothetical protein VH228_00615 [Nocardioides sp.]|nr:hypothetical protein [Nocardioides sp.]
MEEGWGVAVAFAPMDPRQSPNLERPSLEPYYRAMLVTFGSVRRWNPDVVLTLVTTEPPPASHAEALAGLRVLERTTSFAHRPPVGFTDRFAASVYQLDALEAMTGPTLFLDPDVVCRLPLGDLLADVPAGGAGALPLAYAPDYDVNGLSRRQAESIHHDLGEGAGVPVHYGGECYAVSAEARKVLLDRTELAWSDTLERWHAGRPHFVTEEHVLSYALRGVDVVPLDGHVQRIWTAARHRTVSRSDDRLTLWHLPAEKERGFAAVHPAVLDQRSWFWTAPPAEWHRRIARSFGVRHRTPSRLVRDTAGRTLNALERARRRR